MPVFGSCQLFAAFGLLSIILVQPSKRLKAYLVDFAQIAVICVRRLYFHSLNQVPGPLLGRLTSLYSAYHSWRGTMHLDIQRCHQLYGDVIRYAPSQVLSLCPEDLFEIYGHGKPFRKSKGYETMIPIPDGWSTMTSIDTELHRRLRRTFRAGVTAESLTLFEPAITRQLKIFFEELTKCKAEDDWSAPADMRMWNLCLGFDTMSDFGLGLKTNLLRGSARDFVFPALHVHEKKMGLWEQLPELNSLGVANVASSLLSFLFPKARRFGAWYENFLNEAILNNTGACKGIFGPIIQSGLGLAQVPGHNFSQMIGEGAFSTFSSADAYGMMLCGFQHYLSRYPRVYKKLASELRAQYEPGQDIKWDAKLESNAYLRAVIDEVIRLLPPACGVHWRECLVPEVAIGDGRYKLPLGSDVGMSIFSLFRDGRLFRNPLEFWPERWIPGTLPAEEQSVAKRAFVPFLIGSRTCAGSHVAILIASVAFTYILVNYDFRLGQVQPRPSPHLWTNAAGEKGQDLELQFESHYSIAGWESGPFVQFKRLGLARI